MQFDPGSIHPIGRSSDVLEADNNTVHTTAPPIFTSLEVTMCSWCLLAQIPVLFTTDSHGLRNTRLLPTSTLVDPLSRLIRSHEPVIISRLKVGTFPSHEDLPDIHSTSSATENLPSHLRSSLTIRNPRICHFKPI